MLVEPFTVRGSSPTILRAVAADIEAYSILWTTNLDIAITYVAKGQLVATLDAFDLDSMPPRSGRAWLAALPVTAEQWSDNWMAAALAVGEELSGVRLDRAWLGQSHQSVRLYPLPPREPSLEDLLDADMRAIAAQDPRIGAITAEPTHDKLPEIIRIAAELAVTTTGLDGPLIDEAMRLIDTGDRGEAAREVSDRLHALRDEYRAQIPIAQRATTDRGEVDIVGHDSEYGRLVLKTNAVEALCYALNPTIELVDAARRTVLAAGMTQLSQENGDSDRERTLSVITYCLQTR
ncbi:hypothetical protein Acor_66750 [Acrocarpospora corrugata]|uniref:Uncharacterized protein n=1 Tax=Acrocarpospora corrugata TaxID=35763 RepID=A0A5M3W6E2_9ACTN|nr:hypothetical protein Acor_66750 [Acrocarpospora corrugata]